MQHGATEATAQARRCCVIPAKAGTYGTMGSAFAGMTRWFERTGSRCVLCASVVYLSSRTATNGRQIKVPDYRGGQIKVPGYRDIPSVQEILLIDSESACAEVHRRESDRWISEIIRGLEATLALDSVH
jgi:hypothetical protein